MDIVGNFRGVFGGGEVKRRRNVLLPCIASPATSVNYPLASTAATAVVTFSEEIPPEPPFTYLLMLLVVFAGTASGHEERSLKLPI
ncbi:hypothetical protein Ddc_05082 [Ditylenchus destructor]|nr:hypothetical protein Ddc_05082 [Ditylenchus destructor]